VDYQVISFPKARLATIDTGRLSHSKHYMYALLELDVTTARHQLRQKRREGQAVSFNAWIVKTIGDCVAAHPDVHAIASGKRQMVIFRDVDIAIPIESNVNGEPVPLPLLIRATKTKSALDISHEIDQAVDGSITDERDYIRSAHSFSRGLMKLYYLLPGWLRVLAVKRLAGNPHRLKHHSGTVTVTTVSAIGQGAGWIPPTRSWHNLFFGLGTISRKPWVVRNRIEVRDVLNLTVAFNHDVVDGSPARRFLRTLVERVEKGAT
jgi:pyruvate/2-oxoglutarate dehydrogenase complex dihydrolipoamide acyltransferase (E2) component